MTSSKRIRTLRTSSPAPPLRNVISAVVRTSSRTTKTYSSKIIVRDRAAPLP